MAIEFNPIFDGMQNGPEKIKENFDKLADVQNWSVKHQPPLLPSVSVSR